jgi:hypothetical protein
MDCRPPVRRHFLGCAASFTSRAGDLHPNLSFHSFLRVAHSASLTPPSSNNGGRLRSSALCPDRRPTTQGLAIILLVELAPTLVVGVTARARISHLQKLQCHIGTDKIRSINIGNKNFVDRKAAGQSHKPPSLTSMSGNATNDALGDSNGAEGHQIRLQSAEGQLRHVRERGSQKPQ